MPRKIASTKNDRPSNANGRPSTSPNRPIRPGPQQAHLEAEHRAGHRADGEQHRRHLGPALGQPERDGVVAHDAPPVHHVDDGREGDAETGEDDVPAQRDRHLLTCGQTVRAVRTPAAASQSLQPHPYEPKPDGSKSGQTTDKWPDSDEVPTQGYRSDHQEVESHASRPCHLRGDDHQQQSCTGAPARAIGGPKISDAAEIARVPRHRVRRAAAFEEDRSPEAPLRARPRRRRADDIGRGRCLANSGLARPLNKVVAVWANDGKVSGECAGLTSAASAGEVGMLSQPDLPYSCSPRRPHHDGAVGSVAGRERGRRRAGRQQPLVRFSSFRPVDDAAAQLWKDTVRYVKDCVLAHDEAATPLILGHCSRLLAAVTIATFPNSGARACASRPHRLRFGTAAPCHRVHGGQRR